MKVYRITLNGTTETIVAAKSFKEAAKLLGVSVHYLRKYGSITGNPNQIAAAMTSPGTVMQKICGVWVQKN